MRKETAKLWAGTCCFVQYWGQQLARVKSAGHSFVVVWGRELTSDCSFSADVVAVSMLVWFCTPPQQMLQPR